MSHIARLFVAFVFVSSLLPLSTVSAQRTTYQYMQLFYYGPKTTGGPVLRFSPAFKGKTEVTMEQDEYMKTMNPVSFLSPATATVTAATVSSEAALGNGKKQSQLQLEQLRNQQAAANKSQLEAYTAMLSKHVENVTSELTNALNSAAADGWEVTQMASLENGGLVYLLRKAK